MKKLTITFFTFALSFFFYQASALAAAPAETPELLAKGKTAYTTNCLSCHGEKGDGEGPAGKYMKPKPRNFMADDFKGHDGKGKIAAPTVEQVREVIQKGVKGTAMTAYAHIKEADQYAIAYYVLSIRKAAKK